MIMAGIKQSKLSRSAVVGKALLKAGGVHAKSSVQKAPGKHDTATRSHEQIAKIIMQALGELKGVSVKIAQQIALMLPLLPESYLNEMQKSFQSIAPINRALIRKLIKQELGVYPEKLFDAFDSVAIGSASLGQVHRAFHDGKNIALKVQYPGIASTLDSDLGLVKMALKRFAKGNDIDPIMQEISSRLHEEVDYIQEAENIEMFRRNITHPKIVIPEVIGEFSTQRLLATTLLEGQTLERFLQSNPSKALRDHYAQLMFDTLFEMLYKHRGIHADPNPGNFLFMDEGVLGMLDFGCIKRFEESFLDPFTLLHRMLIEGANDAVITQCYVQLGMIDEMSETQMQRFYTEIIKPLDRIYIEVFENDTYHFKSDRSFTRRGFEGVMQVYQKQFDSVHKFNPDYLFLDRTLLGYYAIFERLDATISTVYAKHLIQSYHKGE